MVATPPARPLALAQPQIAWEKLPDSYILPDDPVDNIYQPLLAEALRDGLGAIGLATEASLLPTNYGICAIVDGKIAVKAPDWAYIPHISVPRSEVDRSYTPQLQGDFPVIVMEFLSETDGGEYSSKQTHPLGKWFFYEQILKVLTYVIFDPDGGLLEVYRLRAEHYVLEQPDPEGRHWIAEMGLFLGTWRGQRDDRQGYWLRWWMPDQVLVPWERERAQQARAQVQQERDRADRLADYLRAQGIDPDRLNEKSQI
ncbi:MAG: Uma2 family endonuclease [Synechococcales cyanobacterium RU_4_20]|nr:Uma2 family endonuclease [Synechococcales cyanobacterium RU_4_20]